MYYVFFFKQKTAYEMRISDWSSDVCSSDLSADLHQHFVIQFHGHRFGDLQLKLRSRNAVPLHGLTQTEKEIRLREFAHTDIDGEPLRSEEHTSELQSLMRISYAVFCLKKKNKPSKNTIENN